MNHLAHLYLSRHSEKMMVGNFIADAVKGKKYLLYEEEISRGIVMHRAIDSFTDTNDIVKQSKRLLKSRYGLFSSILIDLFYDYCLAKNWNNYSLQPLSHFAERSYKIFEKYLLIMPERNQRMFPYMEKENWLLHYGNIDGIQRTLQGMARRIKNHPGIENGWMELIQFESELAQQFRQFFPLLEEHVKSFLD